MKSLSAGLTTIILGTFCSSSNATTNNVDLLVNCATHINPGYSSHSYDGLLEDWLNEELECDFSSILSYHEHTGRYTTLTAACDIINQDPTDSIGFKINNIITWVGGCIVE